MPKFDKGKIAMEIIDNNAKVPNSSGEILLVKKGSNKKPIVLEKAPLNP